jgi:hypothetical protein
MRSVVVLLFSVFAHSVYSQRIQLFVDSLEKVIKQNDYNQTDEQGLKFGLWLTYQKRFEYFRLLAVYTSSGIYFKNKRLGVWDTKNTVDGLLEGKYI